MHWHHPVARILRHARRRREKSFGGEMLCRRREGPNSRVRKSHHDMARHPAMRSQGGQNMVSARLMRAGGGWGPRAGGSMVRRPRLFDDAGAVAQSELGAGREIKRLDRRGRERSPVESRFLLPCTTHRPGRRSSCRRRRKLRCFLVAGMRESFRRLTRRECCCPVQWEEATYALHHKGGYSITRQLGQEAS